MNSTFTVSAARLGRMTGIRFSSFTLNLNSVPSVIGSPICGRGFAAFDAGKYFTGSKILCVRRSFVCSFGEFVYIIGV